MSHKTVLFLFIASILALTLAVEVPPQPMPKTTTTSPDTTVSTVPSNTTTTSTTTTTPPTTTTPTTTVTPPTTTSPTTPTTPTTPSTTAVPSTTPTPSPAPPPADVGKWSVRNETTNVTCIIAQMAVQLNVSYPQADSKTGYAIINVPFNTTSATGVCGNVTQKLVLSWTPEGVKDKSHHITLTFNKNETTKLAKVDLIEVVLEANVTEFPGIAALTKINLENKESEFPTNVGMSYSCAKLQTLNLTNVDSNTTVAVIHVSHLQVESFHEKTDANFNSAKDCEPSNTTDIVPIAVGCALVGLVAIVLIAYLVGRRRSQARGYLSIDDHGSQSDHRI